MNKKIFMQKHIDEFFKVSRIEQVDLDLQQVLEFVSTVWEASTPNGNKFTYFEKEWINTLELREDEAIHNKLQYVKQSEDGFVRVKNEE